MNLIYGVIGNADCKRLVEAGMLPDICLEKMHECLAGVCKNENEDILATIFFSKSMYRKEYVLDYIFVREEVRQNGLGTAIFYYFANGLKKMGVKQIRVQYCEDIEKILQMNDFLKKIGFVQANPVQSLLGFSQGANREGKFARLRKADLPIWKDIMEIENYDDRRLRAFWMEQKEKGIYISREEYDPRLCRFYFEDGEIRAAICMAYNKEGDIICKRPYRSSKLKKKDIIPFLIADIGANSADIMNSEKNIYVRSYNEKMYKTICNTFESLKEEYSIVEYIFSI